MDLQGLAEYIKTNYWEQVVSKKNNIISLLNFFKSGNPCQIKINKEKNMLTVINFMENIEKKTAQLIANEITQESQQIEVKINTDTLTLIYTNITQNKYKETIDHIFSLYDKLFEKHGNITEKTIGIRKIKVLGKALYILDRKDIDNLKFLKDLYLTKPSTNGEYLTIYGKDTIKRPILSIENENGEIIIMYIDQNGQLREFNLTKFKEKLNTILTQLGIMEKLTEDDVLDMEKLNNIVYKLKMQTEGKPAVFTPITARKTNLNEETISRVKEIIREAETIMQIKIFDNYLKEKALLKITAHAFLEEKNTIQAIGAKQLISTKIRTVTKLGGGKAIYIGKEELRQINLGDKAKVSVVQLPTGKKILIVEPEEE